MGVVGGVDTGGTGTINLLKSHLSNNTGCITFCSHWRLFGHAWSKHILKITLKAGSRTAESHILTTSIIALSIDMPCMYMNNAQCSMLPSRCFSLCAKWVWCFEWTNNFSSQYYRCSDRHTKQYIVHKSNAWHRVWMAYLCTANSFRHPTVFVRNFYPNSPSDVQTVIDDLWSLDDRSGFMAPCSSGKNREWQ